MTVYTVSSWRVRPGREADFVAAWDALAQWSIEQGLEGHPTLMRDRAGDLRYMDVTPWPSVEHAERWRDDPGVRERLALLEETVEHVEDATLDVVERIG
jgi:heme-degrading monooxygenase HmoA